MRNGEVRILLGSTEKMGSGTNVQKKLVALHNLDCPWRPSDLEQRIGRIHRQGNDNKEVDIYNYVTENSFDAYLYQTIENKQKFISQVMTSKEIARRFSDIDETVLNYAEIKALCSGNPLIKDKLDIEREIGNLEIMRRSHNVQRHRLEDLVKIKGPERIGLYSAKAAEIKADLEILAQYPLDKEDKDTVPLFEIDGKVYSDRKEAGEALMKTFQGRVGEIGKVSIGRYRGFEIRVKYDFTNSDFELTLKCHHSYTIKMGKSADGNITRINNALSEVSLLETFERFEDKIKEIESEIATAKQQLRQDFPQETEYREKLARLEAINRKLGIGVDAELEQAEKPELDKVEVENVGGRNNTAEKIEVLESAQKPYADVSNCYPEYMNKTVREAEKSRPEMKKKREYEAVM